jgi:glycosyltransferase involved in cell wall biosynthesis
MFGKMRIGLLSTYPPNPCGIGRYTSFLTNALLKNYPSLEVFILKSYDEEPDVTLGVTPINCFEPGNFKNDEVIKSLDSLNLDLVHIQHHYGIFGFGDDLFELLSRYPVVITMHEVHTEEFPEKVSLFYRLEDLKKRHYLFGSLARRIIVHSEDMKRVLMGLGVQERKISVIPHGTLFIPRIKRENALSVLNLPSDAKIILSFGFIRKDKNEKLIMEAFPKILKEVPEAYLVMVGSVHPLSKEKDEEVVEERKDIISKYNLKNVVFVERFIPDHEFPLFFSMADLFISLYDQGYHEISGALHLGIGAGVPCVVTRVPRYEEIEMTSPEAVVRVGDRDDLVRVIVRLLKEDELRLEIRRRIEKYREETSWDRISELHYQLYNDIHGEDEFVRKKIA